MEIGDFFMNRRELLGIKAEALARARTTALGPEAAPVAEATAEAAALPVSVAA